MDIEQWLYSLPLRLRGFFRPSQVDEEMREELREHLEQQIKENIAKGMLPEEARRSAVLTIPSGRKCCSGTGNLALAATIASFGACAKRAGNLPLRAKASNRIGAAAPRPTNPGVGAPSGRPTQTPMVRLPSKPTAQASR